jgi:hypothetical protein
MLPSQAAVIVDNITGGPYNAGNNLGNGLGIDASRNWVAFGLTVGSTALNFISLEAIFDNNAVAQSRTVTGGIYEDNNAGAPGTEIAAFNSEVLAPSANNSLLTFTTAQLLLPNTTYWFVLTGPSSLGMLPNWQKNVSNASPVGSAYASPAGYRSSGNNQSAWTSSSANNALRIQADPFGFEEFPLDGVPEPSTFILCASGLLLAGRFIRRR